MKEYVICDHAQECDHSDCGHRRPRPDIEMVHVRCGHIDEFVNVEIIDGLPKGNPNRQFRRKKHGF